MKLSISALNIIANSKVEGQSLYLPEGQLDRKLYLEVNKALKMLGGKWNRSTASHLFPMGFEDALEHLIQTQEIVDLKKKYQFFETPDEVAELMVESIQDWNFKTICEPSAGGGNLVRKITNKFPSAKIWINELQAGLATELSKEFGLVSCADFLGTTRKQDVFFANPPFSKQQDIDHVNHMLDYAEVGVISIMSSSVLYRDNKKAVDFRKRVLELGGGFTVIPAGAFKEAGTNVETVLLIVKL